MSPGYGPGLSGLKRKPTSVSFPLLKVTRSLLKSSARSGAARHSASARSASERSRRLEGPSKALFHLLALPSRAEEPARPEDERAVHQQAQPPAACHPERPEMARRNDQVERDLRRHHDDVYVQVDVEAFQLPNVSERFPLLPLGRGCI